jgi:hypothetical protein
MTPRLVFLVLLLAVIHAGVGWWLCANGLLNADEAFYGLAAREVMHGRLPYRDFGFTQMPLVPYAQGLVMQVIGYGLLTQRLASGFWAALTAIVGGVWLGRRFGPTRGIWFAAALTLSLGWMYNVHLGKTYAVTGFVVLLATIAMLSPAKWSARALALTVLAAVGVGCRLPAAPFFSVLILGLFFENRTWRGAAALAGGGIIFFALVLGPFVAAAPENFWFWTTGFHRASVPLRNFFVAPGELWALAPLFWFAAATLVVAVVARQGVHFETRETWTAVALLAGLAANLLPRGGYAEYATPLVPAGLLLMCSISRGWLVSSSPANFGACALAVVSAVFLPPPTDPGICDQVAAAAAALDRIAPPGRELDGPATLLALETNRPVHPRLLMTPFGFTETMDETLAAQRHLATPDWLVARLADPALRWHALTSQPRWNFGRSMPTFALTTPETLSRFGTRLSADFVLRYHNAAFTIYVRRETSQAVSPALGR